MSGNSRQPRGVDVYRRLLRYAVPYWRVFLVGVIAMVVYAATQTGFAGLMKPLLDGSFVERDPDSVRLIPVVLIGLFLARGLAGYLSSYCTAWVGRRVVTDLRARMFAHLLILPTGYYDDNSSGTLLSTLMFNVEQVAHATTNAVTVLFRDSLTIVGLLALMFYHNVFLTLLFLVVGPLIGVSIYQVGKRLRRLSHNVQNSMGQVSHTAEEAIEAQRVVKIFGGQEFEIEQFRRVNEANRRQQIKAISTDAVSSPVVQLIAAFGFALIIYLASLQSLQDKITVGTFVSFIIAMSMLLAPLKRLTSVNGHIQRGIAAGQSIFEFLAVPPEADTGTRELAHVRGDIVFEDVSHAYASSGHPVLNDINLEVRAGETVAIVGRSGSGKSTLVSLLMRLYDCSHGRILLDGVNIRELTLTSLRSHIALVSQEITLFNATIADNIAYGDPDASEADIHHAADAAYASEFIERLPDGIHSLIGENGVLLSGGQRQRIAIARAIYKDAPVLMLDEATASLDTESERQIQAALERLVADRTTLVIAHRLSTIERADRIIVLEEGRIVEQGRHAELLALNGSYAVLYRLQFGTAAESSDEGCANA